jgi:predicted enzyme related to lactoylglutathione lyase
VNPACTAGPRSEWTSTLRLDYYPGVVIVVLHGVTNVFYFVDDLDAARQWYGELLDAEPVQIQPQLVTFMVGGVRLTLHLADAYNSVSQLKGTVAYWGVDDVDAVVAWCSSRGGVAHRGPKTIFTGERLCQIQDPFGNLFGVRQAPAG